MSASNSLLETYVADGLTTRANFWKTAKRLSFIAPFVLAGALFGLFWRHFGFSGSQFMFSLSLSAVALTLAGIYFSSYKFFGENFYYFIFVSWITNAIYLIPELNGPAIYLNREVYGLGRFNPAYPAFKAAVIGLSLTSTAFLVLALLTRAQKGDSKLTWKEIPHLTYIGLGATAFLYIVIAYLVLHYWFPIDVRRMIAKWMLPSSAVSFVLLWAVGTSLMIRLRPSSPKWIGRTLWGSFVVYASLQLTYPFTVFMANHLPLFLIAQLAKVVNAIAMTGALQSAMVHKEAVHNAQILSTEQEVKIREAELAAQEEKLKSKEQFVKLGMLASAIKHDVVTPLATMGFDLDALREQFQHDHKSTRRLGSLNDSKDRIEAIVKIVDIFRGDKAFFDRDQFMTKANMLEIAHRAVRSVKNERPELKQDNPAIRIKVSGRDVWVRAYIPMLEQVLVNVIKNGIEAIEEAGQQPGRVYVNVGTIDTPNARYSRWVKLEIEDNGCGIPPENIPKLATIFTTRGDKKPNSGIGLFIGNRILEIHNGEFEFRSTVGEGTVVTLLLPEWNALQKTESDTGAESKSESEKASTDSLHDTANSVHNSQDPNQKVSDPTPNEIMK